MSLSKLLPTIARSLAKKCVLKCKCLLPVKCFFKVPPSLFFCLFFMPRHHKVSRLKFKIHKNISPESQTFLDFRKPKRSMNFLVDEKLNEKQLRRLKDHIYSSCGKSILEQKLNPFWNCVVERLPLCAGLYSFNEYTVWATLNVRFSTNQ